MEYKKSDNAMFTGDFRQILPELAAQGMKVQTCITSPPLHHRATATAAGSGERQTGYGYSALSYLYRLDKIAKITKYRTDKGKRNAYHDSQ